LNVTAVERRVELLIDRCYQGLDAAALRVEVLRRLRSIVSVDAAFFATVDPVTLLFTSAISEEPLRESAARFLDNEFGPNDVNRFADLAARRDPIASLDMATRGDRTASLRYTDIMAPLELGDELRVVLRSGSHSWGVMCLHRSRALAGFSERDVGVVRRIAPHLAEGLRRAHVSQQAADAATAAQSGIVLLDDQLRLVSMNGAAEQWLAEMSDTVWPPSSELPVAVYTVAARLRATDSNAWEDSEPPAGGGNPATVRLRTEHGHWVLVHASRLNGPAGPQTAVVIEPASPHQLVSVLLASRGLTPAQERVAALVLRGLNTRDISAQAHVSVHTVQEHLKAIFDKFGVRSRRELVAAVLSVDGGEQMGTGRGRD
jgi:DNA-binding CsgD family transcriptional regulator